MDTNTQAMGKRLVELRGSRTQEEVAKALGISKSALAMYETGKRIPRDTIKCRIANFYKVTVMSIFFISEVHETCTSK